MATVTIGAREDAGFVISALKPFTIEESGYLLAKTTKITVKNNMAYKTS
jgi:hypothetical protein